MAVLLLLATLAKGGEPGTAGANFLQIGAGPRAVAMGEAHTAVADDAYGGYWNPAGLSQLKYPEAALMHNQLGQGVNQQYLAYVHPLRPSHALAGSLTHLSAGTIESYDANGARRGAVNASDLALSVAYGHLLSLTSVRAPEIRLGLGGRWIEERLAAAKASTLAGDFGLLIANLDNAFGDNARGFKLGLALRNVGPGLQFHTERTPLPRTYSAGLAWQGRPWSDPMTVAFDFKSAVDDGAKGSLGVEYWVRRVLALRIGYISGQDSGLGLRFGVGVRLKRVTVEYAMAGFGGLGDMHRFGFTCRFSGAADVAELTAVDFISRGRSYLEQKRYYEAVTQFNRALEIDPGNRIALELMRQALQEMEKPTEKQNAP